MSIFGNRRSAHLSGMYFFLVVLIAIDDLNLFPNHLLTSIFYLQICWNIINPNFNFRHSIPVRVNSDFLEKCCKSNVLILEVWSFSQPKNKLIGIATIPLHQIYVSYKVDDYGIFIEKSFFFALAYIR